MKNRALRKDRIASLLDELLPEHNVVAPVRTGDFVQFERIAKGGDAVLDVYLSKTSPKYLFFPQSEVLLTYPEGKTSPTGERPRLPEAGRKNVLFGIRPCDARSLLMLDKIFDQPAFKDPYYLDRRRNTTLVGWACLKPAAAAFCTSVGGGPFDGQGLDALCADLQDRCLLAPLTERGEELFSRLSGLEDATAQDEARFVAAREKAMGAVRSKARTEGLPEKLTHLFDHPVWERIHETCIGCGTCTYLCPTCHCFDISDEKFGSDQARVRLWDSCMYTLFTLHASGHNPRPTGKERMRQRVMHKFNYTVKNWGDIFCVGCGRCVRDCPVNLDIREVVNELAGVPVEKT